MFTSLSEEIQIACVEMTRNKRSIALLFFFSTLALILASAQRVAFYATGVEIMTIQSPYDILLNNQRENHAFRHQC